MFRTYSNTVCHAGTLPAWPRRDLRTHKFSHHLLTPKLWTYRPPACPSAVMRNSPSFLCFSCSPLTCCALSAAFEKRRKLSFPGFHFDKKEGGYYSNFLSHILSHPPSPSLFTVHWKIEKSQKQNKEPAGWPHLPCALSNKLLLCLCFPIAKMKIMHVMGQIVVYNQRTLLIFACCCPGPNVNRVLPFSWWKGAESFSAA